MSGYNLRSSPKKRKAQRKFPDFIPTESLDFASDHEEEDPPPPNNAPTASNQHQCPLNCGRIISFKDSTEAILKTRKHIKNHCSNFDQNNQDLLKNNMDYVHFMASQQAYLCPVCFQGLRRESMATHHKGCKGNVPKEAKGIYASLHLTQIMTNPPMPSNTQNAPSHTNNTSSSSQSHSSSSTVTQDDQNANSHPINNLPNSLPNSSSPHTTQHIIQQNQTTPHHINNNGDSLLTPTSTQSSSLGPINQLSSNSVENQNSSNSLNPTNSQPSTSTPPSSYPPIDSTNNGVPLSSSISGPSSLSSANNQPSSNSMENRNSSNPTNSSIS